MCTHFYIERIDLLKTYRLVQPYPHKCWPQTWFYGLNSNAYIVNSSQCPLNSHHVCCQTWCFRGLPWYCLCLSAWQKAPRCARAFSAPVGSLFDPTDHIRHIHNFVSPPLLQTFAAPLSSRFTLWFSSLLSSTPSVEIVHCVQVPRALYGCDLITVRSWYHCQVHVV